MDHVPERTTTTESTDPAAVLPRLESQARLAEELAILARGQADLIERGEADDLVRVLERRQALIDRLLQEQSAAAPLTEALERAPERLPASERERAGSLVESISGRLAEVMEIDEKDRHALTARLKEIGQTLNTTGAAQTARRAYGRLDRGVSGGGGGSTPPRFTDRQG